MLKTLLLSLLAPFSILYGQHEETDLITMTYHHGIKLDKIDEPGKKFVFMQLCTTEIDSVISSGNIKLLDSKIGKIKNCVYQWQIRCDTLDSVIIETFKYKNTQQLILQATNQFGNATKINKDASTIYEWNKSTEKSKFTARLNVDETKDIGSMSIIRQKQLP